VLLNVAEPFVVRLLLRKTLPEMVVLVAFAVMTTAAAFPEIARAVNVLLALTVVLPVIWVFAATVTVFEVTASEVELIVAALVLTVKESTADTEKTLTARVT
jgi:hypothetical protein